MLKGISINFLIGLSAGLLLSLSLKVANLRHDVQQMQTEVSTLQAQCQRLQSRTDSTYAILNGAKIFTFIPQAGD